MRKYKIGDTVKMKHQVSYGVELRTALEKHNYVFTIIGFFSDRYYDMREHNGAFQDCHIIEIADNNVDSRFEILDL